MGEASVMLASSFLYKALRMRRVNHALVLFLYTDWLARVNP
jgi:hypothetical protein